MLQIGAPGEGRHVGGSFPMKLNPAIGESEISGRLYGCRNIFLADASVFPTIPASTITFTAMANAHRIASAYALELSS
jgi:choline dehydrogenase-like flavoprotein